MIGASSGSRANARQLRHFRETLNLSVDTAPAARQSSSLISKKNGQARLHVETKRPANRTVAFINRLLPRGLVDLASWEWRLTRIR